MRKQYINTYLEAPSQAKSISEGTELTATIIPELWGLSSKKIASLDGKLYDFLNKRFQNHRVRVCHNTVWLGEGVVTDVYMTGKLISIDYVIKEVYQKGDKKK